MYEKLTEYCKSDFYPMHMPGHKRQVNWCMETYGIDITEIAGFDNLHQPEGIIKEAQIKASELFGVEESFYLVNGSTSGILSAVSTVYREGEVIAAARNSHKSLYNALIVNKAHARYLYPDYFENYRINGGINLQSVETMLNEAKSEWLGF